MIKAFRELNDREIEKVKLYINKAENTKKSINEIKEEFNTKIYNFGEGILFYFKKDTVVGSVKIILETAKSLSTIYILFLTVQEEKDELEITNELLEASIKIGEEKNCNKILLGIREEKMLKLFQKLGYTPKYNAYQMELINREKVNETLELVKLTEGNKEEYLKVFNNSFSDMPHGCYYEMEDIENYLKDKKENKYYLVKDKREIIGFLNTEIKNNIGSFDIGLIKKYRKKGYGKKILETAIDTLNKLKVEKVTLIVIEKNSIAFNMYLKRGFKIYNTLSRWVEIKNSH